MHTPTHRLRRTTIAAATAASLILAACGTSTDDESEATTAPPESEAPSTETPADTAPPVTSGDDQATEPEPTDTEPTDTEPADTEPAATEPPVTEPAGPPADVLFGFNLSSGDINATRAKYGVEGQDSVLLPEDYIVALLDDYNENGGIAGHTVIPVNYTAPTGDVSEDVKDQERCEAYFGGDQVASIVSANNSSILNTCAEDAGAIVFGGGFTGMDQELLDQFPGFVNPDAATYDDVAQAMVDLALEQGVIAEGDTVGVSYSACEDRVRVYDNALEPALEAAGVTISTFAGTCIRSSADEGAAVAELPNAILQWKADGVTAVFNLVSGFIGLGLLMNIAEEQAFNPTWVLTSTNEFGALNTMSPPAAQLENSIALGWTAALDTFALEPADLGARAGECLDRYDSLGFPPAANIGELAGRLGVCSMFYAIEIMLEAVPGELDRTAMIDQLTASTEDTSTLTNQHIWTSGRQPNTSYRIAEFDAAGQQFVYTSDVIPFPEN